MLVFKLSSISTDEGEGMVLELPPPDQTQLAASPLELVVCQVRYETRLVASDSSTARAIHDMLGDADHEYANVEPAGTATVSVVAGGATPAGVSETKLTGWRFTSRDGRWVASVMPDHASLETTAYTTWVKDFEPRLHRLLDAVAEHVQPSFEQRLGLRYIDRIKELRLKRLIEWKPYLRPELLSLLMHPQLGPFVRASQHQTILELDDEAQCGLRHGPLVDEDQEVVDYVLDYDLFRQGGRPFEVEEIKGAAARLNRWAHQLFEATVTDELMERFRKQ